MRRLQCALLATVAAIGFASIASAADMPVKAVRGPIAAPAYNWNGCYVGGDVGWIGGRDRFDTYPSGSISAFNPGPNNHSYTGNGSSVIGGVSVGCNWTATPNWVFGVVADLSGSGLKDTVSADYPAIVQTTPATTWTAHNETLTKELPWLSTFRGRIGYAWNDTMLYATGGLAVARVKASLSYVAVGGVFSNVGSTSSTQTGWTVGGGLEHALDNRWSVKAEYLYVSLGSFSFDSPNTLPGAGDTRAWGTTVTPREHIVRFGVNYKFIP